MGYFVSSQARACGLGWDTLSDGAQSGKYIRLRRSLYRIRDYPSSPREEVMAAWLAVGKDVAVVSHESALDLLELSDVIPNFVHLTVPRSKRNLPRLPGVRIHTTTRPFTTSDVITLNGFKVTSVARTIADSAEAGTGPEQIEMAVQEALHGGVVSRRRLVDAIQRRSERVRNLITGAIELAA